MAAILSRPQCVKLIQNADYFWIGMVWDAWGHRVLGNVIAVSKIRKNIYMSDI